MTCTGGKRIYGSGGFIGQESFVANLDAGTPIDRKYKHNGFCDREAFMKRQVINADMKVWDVIQDHPETYGVFRQFGCPDIHKGTFAVQSHFMKIRMAAHAHHIDLEELLEALNEAVTGYVKGTPATRH